MVFSLQGDLAYATVTRRDQVLAQMQSAVSGRGTWGVDRLSAENIYEPRWEGPPQASYPVPTVRFGLRFTTRQNQEQVVNAMRSLATGVRLPLDSSWYQIHDCSDDEEGHGYCPTPTKFVWTGGVPVQQG